MLSQRGFVCRLFSFLLTAMFTTVLISSDIFKIKSAFATQFELSKPGTMLQLSDSYSDPVLRGLKIDPENPFNFQFVVDTANKGSVDKAESTKLIKYFLAGLTAKNEDIWVNLSPYEKDRITSDVLADTDLGKALLEQDYLLKQLSASLTHPDSDTGIDYWDKFSIDDSQFSAENADLSKIWISPDISEVYEQGNTVLITKATLKVDTQSESSEVDAAALSALLPAVTKEINNGKNFANLRQIYHSLILADWFKDKLKDTFFKHYIDQSKTKGIDINDPQMKENIWNKYYEAFQKGAYDYIKKEKSLDTGRMQKKKYFSGGINNKMNRTQTANIPDSDIFIGKQSSFITVLLDRIAGINNNKKSVSTSTVKEEKEEQEEYRESKSLHFEWDDSESFDDNYNRYMRDYNSSAINADSEETVQSSSVVEDFQIWRAERRLIKSKNIEDFMVSVEFLLDKGKADRIKAIFNSDKKWPLNIAQIIGNFVDTHDSYFKQSDHLYMNINDVAEFFFRHVLNKKKEDANLADYAKLSLKLRYRANEYSDNEQLARIAKLDSRELRVALSNKELFSLVAGNKFGELFDEIVSNYTKSYSGELDARYLGNSEFLANVIANFDNYMINPYDIGQLTEIILKFKPYEAIMMDLLSDPSYIEQKIINFGAVEDFYAELEKRILNNVISYLFAGDTVLADKQAMIEELLKNNFDQFAETLEKLIKVRNDLNEHSISLMVDSFSKNNVVAFANQTRAAMIVEKLSEKASDKFDKATMETVLSMYVLNNERNRAKIYAKIFENILSNKPELIDADLVNLFFHQQRNRLTALNELIFDLIEKKPELKKVIWKKLFEIETGNLVLARYAALNNDTTLTKYLISRKIKNGLTDDLLDYSLTYMAEADSKYQEYADAYELIAEGIALDRDFSQILDGKVIHRWTQKEMVEEVVQTESASYLSGHQLGEDKFKKIKVEKDVPYSETIHLRLLFVGNNDVEALIDYLTILSEQTDELKQAVEAKYDISLEGVQSSSIYNPFTELGRNQSTLHNTRNITAFYDAFDWLMKEGHEDKIHKIIDNPKAKFTLRIADFVVYYKRLRDLGVDSNDIQFSWIHRVNVTPKFFADMWNAGVTNTNAVYALHSLKEQLNTKVVKTYIDNGISVELIADFIKYGMKADDVRALINTELSMDQIMEMAKLGLTAADHFYAKSIKVRYEELIWLKKAGFESGDYKSANKLKNAIEELYNQFDFDDRIRFYVWSSIAFHSPMGAKVLDNLGFILDKEKLIKKIADFHGVSDVAYDFNFLLESYVDRYTVPKSSVPVMVPNPNFKWGVNPGDPEYGEPMDIPGPEIVIEERNEETLRNIDKSLLTEEFLEKVEKLTNMSSGVEDMLNFVKEFVLGKDNVDLAKINESIDSINEATDLDSLYELANDSWSTINEVLIAKIDLNNVFNGLRTVDAKDFDTAKTFILDRAATIAKFVEEYRLYIKLLRNDFKNTELDQAIGLYFLGIINLLKADFDLNVSNEDIIESNIVADEDFKAELKESITTYKASSNVELVDGGVKMEGLNVKSTVASSAIEFKNVDFDASNFEGFSFVISSIKMIDNEVLLASL